MVDEYSFVQNINLGQQTRLRRKLEIMVNSFKFVRILKLRPLVKMPTHVELRVPLPRLWEEQLLTNTNILGWQC